MERNVIVGERSGGPTAAINSSLAGYTGLRRTEAKSVWNAARSARLIEEKYIDLSDHIKTELDAELLKRTPAAFLGSCRYKLPEIHENREVYDKIFAILDKLDIEAFIYIGGNDSMDTIKNYPTMQLLPDIPPGLWAVQRPLTIRPGADGSTHRDTKCCKVHWDLYEGDYPRWILSQNKEEIA